MIFDSELLNLPLEWAEGLENRLMRVVVILLGIFLWVIPVMIIFVTPLLIWNALAGD